MWDLAKMFIASLLHCLMWMRNYKIPSVKKYETVLDK